MGQIGVFVYCFSLFGAIYLKHKEGVILKNNFTFLVSWFPTLIFAFILSALGSGILQMVSKFIFPDAYRIQCFAVYVVLSIIICAALAVVSKKLGIDLNRTSKEFSSGIPVFNMLFCGVIYIVLYALMNGRAFGVLHLFPCEIFISGAVYGQNGAGLGDRLVLAIIQFWLYFTVSLSFYIMAKKKAENSEGVKKLRGEKKKTNNRFGIDFDI